MAQVTVRVRLDKTFVVIAEGINSEQVIDDIIDNDRLTDDFISACCDAMDVVESDTTYDEPEPEDTTGEDDDEDEEEIEDEDEIDDDTVDPDKK